MTPKLSCNLNRPVMVSIPALFEDGACRPFTLLGAEPHGLWLQSDELAHRLLPPDQQDLAATAAIAVFVPFAQIAGVLVAAGPATDRQPPEGAPPTSATVSKSRARPAAKKGRAAAPKR